MKLNFSVALLAAVAVAIAASPSEAATKKKKAKSAAPKVVVTKSQPFFAGQFNGCATASSRMWFPFAAVGTVGCGLVYAVPVVIEGFMYRA